jgi:hypothetical protein
MRTRISLALCIFTIVSYSFAGGQSRVTIDDFKVEAEAALGASITIHVADTGIDLGQTFCDKSHAEIAIAAGLSEPLRTAVLSHELGHVILCARGISGMTRSSTDGILSAVSSAIGSCYMDPLADSEAVKRGFNPTLASEYLAQRVEAHTDEEISSAIARNGNLQVVLIAVSTYCYELRPQTRNIEGRFKAFPDVLAKISAYHKDLGEPVCGDEASCLALMKKLRDELNLRGQVWIQNPATLTFE